MGPRAPSWAPMPTAQPPRLATRGDSAAAPTTAQPPRLATRGDSAAAAAAAAAPLPPLYLPPPPPPPLLLPPGAPPGAPGAAGAPTVELANARAAPSGSTRDASTARERRGRVATTSLRCACVASGEASKWRSAPFRTRQRMTHLTRSCSQQRAHRAVPSSSPSRSDSHPLMNPLMHPLMHPLMFL